MKKQIINKIFWYGFKQQLKELYYLLFFEKYISCDADEFISHFTGKKFRIDQKITGKLNWNKDNYLLVLLMHHLTSKKFIAGDYTEILKTHFTGIPDSVSVDYNKNKNKPEAKNLQAKLEILFPADTGIRCKQRLYYRARNKDNEFAILKKCGINV